MGDRTLVNTSMAYYAVTDVRNGKASAIIKDHDMPLFDRIDSLKK